MSLFAARKPPAHLAIRWAVVAAATFLACSAGAFTASPRSAARANIPCSTCRVSTWLPLSSNGVLAAAEEEEMVTLLSMSMVVRTKPLGVVVEELGGGSGVFAAEVDPAGAAYEAGIRDGDILASLDGDGAVREASLDEALALLAAVPAPFRVDVYREMEEGASQSGGSTVKMAPRRLPSTKKLIKASTNANFWQDPLMMGSAVLTVAMPLGIYLASSVVGK